MFTSLFTIQSLYDIPQSFLKHFITVVWILLSISAVSVQISQEYSNIEIPSSLTSLILDFSDVFLYFHNVLILVIATIVLTMQNIISDLEPLSWTLGSLGR